MTLESAKFLDFVESIDSDKPMSGWHAGLQQFDVRDPADARHQVHDVDRVVDVGRLVHVFAALAAVLFLAALLSKETAVCCARAPRPATPRITIH